MRLWSNGFDNTSTAFLNAIVVSTEPESFMRQFVIGIRLSAPLNRYSNRSPLDMDDINEDCIDIHTGNYHQVTDMVDCEYRRVPAFDIRADGGTPLPGPWVRQIARANKVETLPSNGVLYIDFTCFTSLSKTVDLSKPWAKMICPFKKERPVLVAVDYCEKLYMPENKEERHDHRIHG